MLLSNYNMGAHYFSAQASSTSFYTLIRSPSHPLQLHYFYMRLLYTDLFASCSANGRCVVKNDNALAPWSGSLQLSVLKLATGASTVLYSVAMSLPQGAGEKSTANMLRMRAMMCEASCGPLECAANLLESARYCARHSM